MTASSRRWLVAAVGLSLIVANFGLISSDALVDVEWLVTAFVIYAVAAITVIRVPGNRVSWVLLAISVGFVLTSFSWLPNSVGSASNFLGIFALILPGLGVFLPLWFPTGFAPTPRWRWIERLAWVALVGILISQVVGYSSGEVNDDIDGCVSIVSCVEVTSLLVILLSMGGAVMSLVVRWFRSQGVQRQQMKGVVFAFFVFFSGTAIEFGVEQDHPVGLVLFFLGGLMIPVAIGVGIARYRLYEIDRIMSRTVSYTVVVGLLAAAVAAVAALAGSQFQEPWIVAATTLGVAALFNPLRKRVQAWVDRRFNRSRYDAERVAAGFAGSLRDRVDVGEVVEGWVGVVAETMQPVSMGIWVRDDR